MSFIHSCMSNERMKAPQKIVPHHDGVIAEPSPARSWGTVQIIQIFEGIYSHAARPTEECSIYDLRIVHENVRRGE